MTILLADYFLMTKGTITKWFISGQVTFLKNITRSKNSVTIPGENGTCRPRSLCRTQPVFQFKGDRCPLQKLQRNLTVPMGEWGISLAKAQRPKMSFR